MRLVLNLSTIENSPRLNTSEFSVSFWVKKNVAALHTVTLFRIQIIRQGRAGILTWVLKTTVHELSFASMLQTMRVTHSDPKRSSLALNDFVNIIGVFNGSRLTTYVDGKLLGTVAFNGTYYSDPRAPLKIGSASCMFCMCELVRDN